MVDTVNHGIQQETTKLFSVSTRIRPARGNINSYRRPRRTEPRRARPSWSRYWIEYVWCFRFLSRLKMVAMSRFLKTKKTTDDCEIAGGRWLDMIFAELERQIKQLHVNHQRLPEHSKSSTN